MENHTQSQNKLNNEIITNHSILEKKQSDNSWKVILAILSLCIIGYGIFYHTNTIDDITWLIGYYLPGSVIFWLFFYFIFIRKKGVKVAAVAFVIIYASVMISGYISVTVNKIEAKKAISEIKTQFESTIESSLSPEGMPEHIPEETQISARSQGIFGEMEKFIKTFMNQTVSLRNDLLLEFNAIGWDKILDPTRIKNDTTFSESKYIIGKAKEINEKYKAKFDTLFFEEAYDEIDSLAIEENYKNSMKDGFKEGMIPMKAMLDKVRSLDKEFIIEVEKLLDFLSLNKESWTIEGQQIIFYNDNDLNEYNKFFFNIQDIVKEQQEIQQQSVEKSLELLKSMEENLK